MTMSIKTKCNVCGEIVKINTTEEKAVRLLDAVTLCPCCGSEDIKKIVCKKAAPKEHETIVLSVDLIEEKDEFDDVSTLYVVKMSAYDRTAFYFIHDQLKEQYPDVTYSMKHQGWISSSEEMANEIVETINANPTKEERKAVRESRKKK